MATTYGLDGRVSIPGKGIYFSFPHSVPTDFGVHTALSPEVKWPQIHLDSPVRIHGFVLK
jgi:hypothetical protein